LSASPSTALQVIALMKEQFGNVFKFVMVTGLSQTEADELAVKCGAVGTLCKPFKPDQVLELVNKIVGAA
jgi:DNA-binding response OmpR family regulator